MKKTRKWVSLTLVLLLGLSTLFTLSVCGKTVSKGKKPFTIGYANGNDIYEYHIVVREALKKYAAAEGIKVLVADSKGDVNIQNGLVETYLAQKVDLVAVIAVDPTGTVPAAELCNQKGVPFVAIAAPLNYDKYILVSSENFQAGQMQGEYLAKVLPQGAKVLILTGKEDQQIIDRKKGLQDKLFNVRKDVKLLAEQNCDLRKDKAMAVTENWIQKYSAFDCIVAFNDDAALGAIEALKAANRLTGVTVVGLDGSDAAVASIKAGELTMSVKQDAAGQAKAVVEIAKRIRDGENYKKIKNIIIPFAKITKENVDQFIKK